MSHAKNKVDWCFRKAEIELKQGKKHRGLIVVEPSIEKARKHLAKAEHNLSAVQYFNSGGFSDWSMSAVFYTIYHCFLAILAKLGYESRLQKCSLNFCIFDSAQKLTLCGFSPEFLTNQECTIALIKHLNEQQKLNIEERFIIAIEDYNEEERHETNIIEKREFYTYGTTTSAEDNEIDESIKLCKDCLNQTKEFIFGGRDEANK